jgi:hypothetical protein
MIAAVPWTYWLAWAWIIVDAVVLVVLVVMYYRKVLRLEAMIVKWQDRLDDLAPLLAKMQPVTEPDRDESRRSA